MKTSSKNTLPTFSRTISTSILAPKHPRLHGWPTMILKVSKACAVCGPKADAHAKRSATSCLAHGRPWLGQLWPCDLVGEAPANGQERSTSCTRREVPAGDAPRHPLPPCRLRTTQPRTARPQRDSAVPHWSLRRVPPPHPSPAGGFRLYIPVAYRSRSLKADRKSTRLNSSN